MLVYHAIRPVFKRRLKRGGSSLDSEDELGRMSLVEPLYGPLARIISHGSRVRRHDLKTVSLLRVRGRARSRSRWVSIRRGGSRNIRGHKRSQNNRIKLI